MSKRPHRESDQGDPLLRQIAVPLQQCPYLPGHLALLPPEFPLAGELTPEQLDRLLARGYRRCGPFYYRTQCPNCSACIPLRLPVARYVPTESQRRVERRGDRQLKCQVKTPRLDRRRIELFNAHRDGQNLVGDDSEPITPVQYADFLLNSTCQTSELAIYHENRLIAVSILDVGDQSASAVYTFFDPEFGRFSLGTYAIIKHIRWAQRAGRQYCYLGFYVADNQHLNYKIRFRPNELYLDQRWQAAAAAESGCRVSQIAATPNTGLSSVERIPPEEE